jgi:ElaB/YqjD/DUF883 family membrane-anchored ribosome-binding protein
MAPDRASARIFDHFHCHSLKENLMKRFTRKGPQYTSAFAGVLLATALGACNAQDDPLEDTQEQMQEAYEESKETVGDAVDEMQDGAEDLYEDTEDVVGDAVDDMEDGADEIGDEAEEAVEDAEDEVDEELKS